MISTPHSTTYRRNSNETRHYATDEDFQRLFETEITDLFRLSLQLTADSEMAERCLILAMRECFGRTDIGRDFLRIWARRMLIQNAIRQVLGIDNDSGSHTGRDLHLQPTRYGIEELRESIAVLELPNFDRLVFVICVLERLSILDCALLLRRSPKDVSEAIVRAMNQVTCPECQEFTGATARFQTSSTQQVVLQ